MGGGPGIQKWQKAPGLPPGAKAKTKTRNHEKFQTEKTSGDLRSHHWLLKDKVGPRLQVHLRGCRSGCLCRGRSRVPRAGVAGTAVYAPGPQPPSPQPHEHRADQLPEGRGVHGVQLVLLAVPEVVAVQGAPGQAHALGRLVIVQQPLELEREGGSSEPGPGPVLPLLETTWLQAEFSGRRRMASSPSSAHLARPALLLGSLTWAARQHVTQKETWPHVARFPTQAHHTPSAHRARGSSEQSSRAGAHSDQGLPQPRPTPACAELGGG